jgi:hypothetical protein
MKSLDDDEFKVSESVFELGNSFLHRAQANFIANPIVVDANSNQSFAIFLVSVVIDKVYVNGFLVIRYGIHLLNEIFWSCHVTDYEVSIDKGILRVLMHVIDHDVVVLFKDLEGSV